MRSSFLSLFFLSCRDGEALGPGDRRGGLVAIRSAPIALLFMLFAFHAHGAYISSIPQEQTAFINERQYVLSEEKHEALVFYDNLHRLPGRDRDQRWVYPYSRFFVPMDQISGNVSLHLVNRRPVTPEFSLARLIYADMKLKKLLDEYRRLQKRSIELLSRPLTPANQPAPPPPVESGADSSVFMEKKRIVEDYEIIVNALAHGSVHGGENDVGHADVQNFTPGGWLKEADREERRAKFIEQQRSLQRGRPVYEEQFAAGDASDPKTTSLTLNKVPIGRALGGEESSLPWVLRLPLKFYAYLTNHKRLAIVIGVILIGAISYWTSRSESQRSR